MPVARRDSSKILPLALFSGALFLSPTLAHADIYHAVIAGETLSSVAAKYRVTPAQIRALNVLSESDTAPLGAMLLRVPESSSAITAPLAPNSQPTHDNFSRATTPVVASSTKSNAGGSGFVGRTMLETVRVGDSWDSIAARYEAAGHEVSSQDLQKRNNWQPLPTPGQTVIVPLGQIAYSMPARPEPNKLAPRIETASTSFPTTPRVSAAAQTAPSASYAEPRPLGGGVYASGEVNISAPVSQAPKSAVPVAKDNSAKAAPVFGAQNGGNFNGSRGTLPSRGGYGQLARIQGGGEVRMVPPGEDAAAPPAPRVTTNVAAPKSSIARVAKVRSSGAQIRRLPMSAAVTLYRCSVGTQLAVLRQENGWSAVLMSDRSTGWMPSKYLALTNDQVDVSIPANLGDGPGGSAAWSVGRYRTTSPNVAQALTWLGTRYVYGGTSRRGIDCSALVMRSFAANGIRLPRTAAQQARVGTAVAPAELRAGDRLYFSASGSRIDHTGLYMGDGLFVHASGSGRSVIVSNLYTPRNWNIFVGARR